MKPALLVPSLVLAAALAATSAPAAGPSAGRAPAVSRSSAPRMVLPFIQDDYARAVALARARKVPLFIEAWAPW